MSDNPVNDPAQNGDGAYMPPDLAVTHDHLLGETVAVTQPKDGFRVGTDAVLLAASLAQNRGRVLDLGAGVGGVSLCLAKRLDKIQIAAVEIDPVLAALARQNAAANGFAARLRVINGDIMAMPSMLANSFDHIVSNPPYHYAAGTRPSNRRRALAHMGEGCGLTDWVKAALWAAKPRGRITFICRADRGAELIHLFAAAGASEALLFPLWPRAGVAAGRVIISLRKNISGPGAILPGLILHNEDGSFTPAATAIMKGGALPMIHPARRGHGSDADGEI